MLTSVATASESRADINAPYRDDGTRSSDFNAPISPYTPTNTSSGHYSPGLRSSSAQRLSQSNDGFEVQGQAAGDVQMQSFQDGLPPPPPVTHTWRRIDAWAEDNYPELFDQLGEGATQNDLNELEHILDCSLPQDVRESLMVHDGQERLGMPTGIIFSSMLLDCEEIVQEWENWRKVTSEILDDAAALRSPIPAKPTVNGASSSSNEASSSRSHSSPRNSGSWRQDLMARQSSIPPNAIQKTYAHPAWIPLVRDWGGNNIAVDLAPGPAGNWGQVILFGRDYDTKYVVARSWAAFLAVVADDMSSGRWFVDEDTNELKLKEFKQARVEPSYFEILRWRMDQKHGRRAAAVAAKRKSMAPGRGSPTAPGSPTSSPYASPTDPNAAQRGRSMQRLSSHSPLTSPKPGAYGKSSPLARVNEESLAPIVTTDLKPPKLVEVDTPRPSEDDPSTKATDPKNGDSAQGKGKENEAPGAKLNGKLPDVNDGAMRTIEI